MTIIKNTERLGALPFKSQLRRLNESDLEEVINSLHKRPLMAGEDGLRLSLAGAQDKLPVVMDGMTVCLPLDNTPSTHIIKPVPDRFPGLVSNELFCMKLAKQVGLNVPDVFNRPVGGRDCLVIKRYDRILGEKISAGGWSFCKGVHRLVA